MVLRRFVTCGSNRGLMGIREEGSSFLSLWTNRILKYLELHHYSLFICYQNISAIFLFKCPLNLR